MKRATQIEIAKRLNLNRRTISRVLNNASNVKESTRRSVITTLNKNGYYLQIHTKPETIVFDIVNRDTYSGSYVVELMGRLSGRDFQFLVSNHTGPRHPYAKLVQQSNILVFGEGIPIKVIEEAREINPDIFIVNLFSMNTNSADVSITTSPWVAGKMACDYLMENGHKKILVISDPAHGTLMQRTHSFWAEIEFNHPDCKAEICYIPLDHLIKSGKMFEMIQEYFKKNKQNMPTAVFCTGGLIGYCLLEAVKPLGIRIPEDLSVLTIDRPEDIGCTEVQRRLDSIIFRAADIVTLAEYYISNRPLLKSGSRITTSPHIFLEINGSVKNINIPYERRTEK